MPKVKKRKENGAQKYLFMCPGCGFSHKINDGWRFNGDFEKPTFKPSVLMRTGHYVNNGSKGNCWCDYEERFDEEPPFDCRVCHSFITDGKIQFLNDCTHELAGQTVELPDFDQPEKLQPVT